ncbi:MAG: imidazole glycerol phosphate synthase subunit HisH [Candidatus Omnitrophica bacterium]|nr:imidazole glycerol phosphate synthase subunit HisH [Candidatus Omnitrophota bacterium]MDD5691034.1 imidazole glycerol phosphate synthase subunit HisH [Candidatus Omnitrophota bacterium]
MKIAIIDYGMGNIHSVSKAIELCGAKPIITNKKSQLSSCEKIVLPGVGAFDDAVTELEKLKLIPVIKEQVKNKKPFLGICLGMQLLFETSQEAKSKAGLGILKGQVIKFSAKLGQKVPHMGWNNLEDISAGCSLLNGITARAQVYFCHSYYPEPVDKDVVAASCNYGVKFACALAKENIYGVQFHPEKSQAIGLKIIRNFVELC